MITGPRQRMRAVRPANPNKNSFDLSNYWTGSSNLGYLIPVRWDDVTPDSHWRIKTNLLIKLAPVLAPFMHRIDAYVHTFFVPYRLCMPSVSQTNTDWENFIQGDPNSKYTNELLPYITLSNSVKAYFYTSTLANYLGLPLFKSTDTIASEANTNLCNLPFLAYQLIWDEYYRNPWTQERNCGPTSDFNVPLYGGDGTSYIAYICALKRRSYERDYFTGAYPEAYAGASTDVELDLNVYGDGTKNTAGVAWADSTDGSILAAGSPVADGSGRYLDESGPGNNITFHTGTQLPAVSTLEILELRRSQALTRFLEAENRTGTERYDEWLKIMFGVTNPDFRHQYPVYIGGGKQTIQVSEVLSTSESLMYNTNDLTDHDILTPQGYQVGHAVGAGASDQSYFHATEHGIIMTILSVIPKTAYSGGVERFWWKTDRTEFYNPHFQHIGDQEIYEGELAFDCSDDNPSNNQDTWAYAPRFAEYKHKLNIVCGDFIDTMDYWHMARVHIPYTDGSATPFSSTFHQVIHSDDQNIRIFANETTTDDHLYIQVYNDVQVILPMELSDIPY